MEQLNLFEAAGMDADTGLLPVTFTKQELIDLYKELAERVYTQYQTTSMSILAVDFLSHTLESK